MKLQRSISESLLNQSLIMGSDAIVRELAMACKKVSIYSALHPVSQRALEKLLQTFKEVFKAKKFVIFNLESGRLHVMNLRQRDTVFTEEVTRLLRTLEMRAVCFHDNLILADLTALVERLVKKEPTAVLPSFVPAYLTGKNIDTIEVNTELAHRLFEQNMKFRGDFDRDFTVRMIAFEQLGEDVLRLAELYDGSDKSLKEASIDFNNEIIQYLIPERIASLKSTAIVEQLDNAFANVKSSGSDPALSVKQQKQLGRLLSLHPERSAIINSLHIHHGGLLATLIRASVLPSIGEYDLDDFDGLANIEAQFFTIKESQPAAFAEMFLRFYRTGRRGQSIEITDFLVKQLSASDWHVRQKSLNFILECLKGIDPITDTFILENIVVRLSQIIDSHTENLEHSELISFVLEQGFRGRRFQILVELVDALARRRSESNGVLVFDSMTIKSGLMKLNRAEILNYLIDELAAGNPGSSKIIQRILIAVGTEEVAQALLKIISHPSRQLRQQVLKILIDMGRPALAVCSAVLNYKLNFERPSERSELPDYKWYIVRNAIYVLGSLQDQAAVEPLRQRMNDPDIRVRREIILALEKIGGEDACDIFLLMAEDPSMDIRELALTKLGLIGNADYAPLLIDLIQRVPQMSIKCVQTMGQLGGEPGKTFLALLLQEEHKSDDITQGRVPKEDFKAAVVRALARLGDPDSIESIKEYSKALTKTQKILIKDTALELALTEALKAGK